MKLQIMTREKIWFLLHCNLVGKKKVTLDREEHDKYQWVTLEELCAIEETELVPYMKSLANIMKKYLKIQQYFDLTLE